MTRNSWGINGQVAASVVSFFLFDEKIEEIFIIINKEQM